MKQMLAKNILGRDGGWHLLWGKFYRFLKQFTNDYHVASNLYSRFTDSLSISHAYLHGVFTAALPACVKVWRQPMVLSTMNEWRKQLVYTMVYDPALQRRKACLCSHLHEQHAKWNKVDAERKKKKKESCNILADYVEFNFLKRNASTVRD